MRGKGQGDSAARRILLHGNRRRTSGKSGFIYRARAWGAQARDSDASDAQREGDDHTQGWEMLSREKTG